MFMTLTILPWYTGIILAMAEFFGMHHVRPFPHILFCAVVVYLVRYPISNVTQSVRL